MGTRPSEAALVSGRLVELQVSDDEVESWTDGDIQHGRGLRERQVIDWSDLRLPAVRTVLYNYEAYPHDAGFAAMFVGAYLPEDEDGSWVGTSTGLTYPDGHIEAQDNFVGRGIYEGLHAVLFASADTPPSEGGTMTWRGVLFEGHPTPTPGSDSP